MHLNSVIVMLRQYFVRFGATFCSDFFWFCLYTLYTFLKRAQAKLHECNFTVNWSYSVMYCYTWRWVYAKGRGIREYGMPCLLFMITEVSIRCQKNPEVGIRRIPAYTPNTPLVIRKNITNETLQRIVIDLQKGLKIDREPCSHVFIVCYNLFLVRGWYCSYVICIYLFLFLLYLYYHLWWIKLCV